MRLRWSALAVFLALWGASAAVRAAAAEPCGTPLPDRDGWSIEQEPRLPGFSPDLLCDAVRTFVESTRNRHALVVERHGKLVVDAYRTGADRSTYSIWASRTQFDKDQLHDVRSITKSVVAVLWGINDGSRVVPPLATPVLDLLPALADLRSGGRERITVADMLCMRSGLAWEMRKCVSTQRTHLDKGRAAGCTMAALGGDAARQPEAVRAAFAAGIESLLAALRPEGFRPPMQRRSGREQVPRPHGACSRRHRHVARLRRRLTLADKFLTTCRNEIYAAMSRSATVDAPLSGTAGA